MKISGDLDISPEDQSRTIELRSRDGIYAMKVRETLSGPGYLNTRFIGTLFLFPNGEAKFVSRGGD